MSLIGFVNYWVTYQLFLAIPRSDSLWAIETRVFYVALVRSFAAVLAGFHSI